MTSVEKPAVGARVLTVAEALARILEDVPETGQEFASLSEAAGRTLATDLAAERTQPPFDASAMDGYAVRREDIASLPSRLDVAGTSQAGRGYKQALKPRQAVRIFTGAPVPLGADMIVIQENTRASGESVDILENSGDATHIRPYGGDFKAGQIILKRGDVLVARSVLIAAAMGFAKLLVRIKPRIAILSTGDELVWPGEAIGADQIACSNPFAIAAQVAATGGAPHILDIAKDTLEAIEQRLAECENDDVLVTIGGASVGDHDLVRPALEKAGADLKFYKVAMRPGKPVFFGTRKRTGGRPAQRIVGLPGNPVSALVTSRVFLVPLIAKMLGRDGAPRLIEAELAVAVASNGPRDHYMRARLDTSRFPPRVTPLANQDSSLTSVLAEADCLALIPAGSPAMPAGARISVLPLDF